MVKGGDSLLQPEGQHGWDRIPSPELAPQDDDEGVILPGQRPHGRTRRHKIHGEQYPRDSHGPGDGAEQPPRQIILRDNPGHGQTQNQQPKGAGRPEKIQDGRWAEPLLPPIVDGRLEEEQPHEGQGEQQSVQTDDGVKAGEVHGRPAFRAIFPSMVIIA